MKNIRKYFGFSVITLVLSCAIYYLFPTTVRIFSLPIKGLIDQRIVIGLTFTEVDQNDFDLLKVPLWQQDYYYKLGISPVIVSLDYIYIPKRLNLSKSFCIQSIAFNVNDVPASLKSNLLNEPLCFATRMKHGINYLFTHSSDIKTYIYSSSNNPFLYPFDKRTMNTNLLIEGAFLSENGELIDFDPHIQSDSNPPRWISFSRAPTQQADEKYQEINSLIVFSRPRIYKFLSVILPITVIILIIILPTRKNERDSFGEITVGFTLGLWSLSEVLIPKYIDFPTLIGDVILFLYFPLAISVIRAYWNYYKKGMLTTVETKTSPPNPKTKKSRSKKRS